MTSFDLEPRLLRANALLKVEAYGQASKVLTLAEDSGLAVAALHGAPGVRWRQSLETLARRSMPGRGRIPSQVFASFRLPDRGSGSAKAGEDLRGDRCRLCP